MKHPLTMGVRVMSAGSTYVRLKNIIRLKILYLVVLKIHLLFLSRLISYLRLYNH